MKFISNIKKCRLLNKLYKKHGLTMIEMLAATAILSLLLMMLSTGLFMAQKSYAKMNAEAETQVLISTISNVLSNELRYARDVESKEGVLQRYTSINYGRNTIISINDKGYLLSSEKAMLPSGAYGNGEYKINELKIMCEENGVFHIYVGVEGRFGVSTQTEFYINCLNKPENEGGIDI